MLRDKNLIPLSHQHRRALAIAVNIARGRGPGYTDPERWRGVIVEHYESDMRFHFEAEETILFPAAEACRETAGLVNELRAEHMRLRKLVENMRGGTPTIEVIREFGALLDAHIRKEERGLFERMQEQLPAEKMAELGTAMNRFFETVPSRCAV